MHRAILLLTAVVLAGCVGGLNPDPAASRTEPPDADWAGAADGDGLDVAALADNHFAAVRDAGSVTIEHSETVAVDGEKRPDGPRPDGYTPPSYTRHHVDLDDGRYLGESVTEGDRRSASFVSPDEAAVRRVPCPSDCDPEYDYRERPDDPPRSERIDRYRTDAAVEGVERLLSGGTIDFDYAYDGTVDRDGETLHRYRAERTLDAAPPPFSEPPRGTATVLVTDDGVVRSVEIEYAGTASVTVDGEERTVDVTHTFRRTYTAVGETTVDRPAWVDHAAEADPQRSTESEDT